MFGEVPERMEVFLDYENIDLKQAQNLHFSKGSLDHGFCQKIKPFSIYCFNAKWINKKSSEKF